MCEGRRGDGEIRAEGEIEGKAQGQGKQIVPFGLDRAERGKESAAPAFVAAAVAVAVVEAGAGGGTSRPCLAPSLMTVMLKQFWRARAVCVVFRVGIKHAT